MKTRFFLLSIFICVLGCTKKVGFDPETPYSDNSLFDSTQHTDYYYYKNNSTSLLSGSNGPHGTFKLRFNSIAWKALTDSGRLPANAKFPEGSFIVKDVYKNGSIDIYAYMYKHGNTWLWGEVFSNGKFQYTKKDGPSVCASCHSQSGNRDMAVSFKFY
jgi:hypothetical protein